MLIIFAKTKKKGNSNSKSILKALATHRQNTGQFNKEFTTKVLGCFRKQGDGETSKHLHQVFISSAALLLGRPNILTYCSDILCFDNGLSSGNSLKAFLLEKPRH